MARGDNRKTLKVRRKTRQRKLKARTQRKAQFKKEERKSK